MLLVFGFWFRVVGFRVVNPQPYYAFLTALVKRPLRLCGVLLRLCAKQKDPRISAKFLRFPRETKQVEVHQDVFSSAIIRCNGDSRVPFFFSVFGWSINYTVDESYRTWKLHQRVVSFLTSKTAYSPSEGFR